MPLVTLDRRDDGIAVITLNRPKMNAMSSDLLAELHDVAASLSAAPPRAVVIWGGDRVFAAGADIAEFGGPSEARAINSRFRSAIDAVAAIPRFVIAAITGYALGGGCELALACDWRIAADNARLGQPEILLGIIPGGGGTQRLPRLVGAPRAKEIIVTGRHVMADEALRIGLVDEVAPAGEVLGRALAKAAEVAKGAAVAQGYVKEAVDLCASTTLEDGLEREGQLFEAVFETNDARTGVQSFLAHGPGQAEFTGG